MRRHYISALHSHQGLTISYVGATDIHSLCAQIKLLNSEFWVVGQLPISEAKDRHAQS